MRKGSRVVIKVMMALDHVTQVPVLLGLKVLFVFFQPSS